MSATHTCSITTPTMASQPRKAPPLEHPQAPNQKSQKTPHPTGQQRNPPSSGGQQSLARAKGNHENPPSTGHRPTPTPTGQNKGKKGKRGSGAHTDRPPPKTHPDSSNTSTDTPQINKGDPAALIQSGRLYGTFSLRELRRNRAGWPDMATDGSNQELVTWERPRLPGWLGSDLSTLGVGVEIGGDSIKSLCGMILPSTDGQPIFGKETAWDPPDTGLSGVVAAPPGRLAGTLTKAMVTMGRLGAEPGETPTGQTKWQGMAVWGRLPLPASILEGHGLEDWPLLVAGEDQRLGKALQRALDSGAQLRAFTGRTPLYRLPAVPDEVMELVPDSTT